MSGLNEALIIKQGSIEGTDKQPKRARQEMSILKVKSFLIGPEWTLRPPHFHASTLRTAIEFVDFEI